MLRSGCGVGAVRCRLMSSDVAVAPNRVKGLRKKDQPNEPLSFLRSGFVPRTTNLRVRTSQSRSPYIPLSALPGRNPVPERTSGYGDSVKRQERRGWARSRHPTKARQTSPCGTLPTLGECPHGVGQQPSATQLSITFAAFDDRPNQLPGAGTDLPGWRS